MCCIESGTWKKTQFWVKGERRNKYVFDHFWDFTLNYYFFFFVKFFWNLCKIYYIALPEVPINNLTIHHYCNFNDLFSDLGEIRPRTSSLPTRNNVRRPLLQYLSPPPFTGGSNSPSHSTHSEFYQIRSFETTSKGKECFVCMFFSVSLCLYLCLTFCLSHAHTHRAYTQTNAHLHTQPFIEKWGKRYVRVQVFILFIYLFIYLLGKLKFFHHFCFCLIF